MQNHLDSLLYSLAGKAREVALICCRCISENARDQKAYDLSILFFPVTRKGPKERFVQHGPQ